MTRTLQDIINEADQIKAAIVALESKLSELRLEYRDMQDPWYVDPSVKTTADIFSEAARELRAEAAEANLAEAGIVEPEVVAPQRDLFGPTPATEGMYQLGDKIYKVVFNRAKTNLYAQEVTESGFVYAPGVVRLLNSDHKMSLEQAAAYGKATGRCCVCCAELTNPESIELGIGPICRTKF